MPAKLPDIARLHERLPREAFACDRVRAIIDLPALIHNYTLLSGRVQAASPRTRCIAVVKADAYGHGVIPCAGALLHAGCRSFAVACLEEAVVLRQFLTDPCMDSTLAATPDAFGTCPADSMILILGYTAPEHVTLLAQNHLATAVVSTEHAVALSKAASEAGVCVTAHVALDTGMNRIGLPAHSPEEIARAIEDMQYISALPGLYVEGMFTHFATADEDYDSVMAQDSSTLRQYRRYGDVLEGLVAAGCRPPFCHVCNSAAAVRFPQHNRDMCLDGVRLGINLYGYGVAFHEPADVSASLPGLRPVMRLETSVFHLHTLLPGERVGYGGLYQADAIRRIATLPVGYADGWIRALRGASVVVHTAAGDVVAPVVGRICMDQCMLDVTDLPVALGDRVTLFGDTSDQLEALASRADTITYELLCLITARVPRIIKAF